MEAVASFPLAPLAVKMRRPQRQWLGALALEVMVLPHLLQHSSSPEYV